MFEPLTRRRYLIPFKAARLPQQFTDVLVVGGGVAGARAALAASSAGADVVLLTKDTVDQSNTWYAQGGIAAVLQPMDSVESHIADTETVGCGLCDSEAVRIVIEEGPRRVLELLEWGAQFDKAAAGSENAHGLAYGLEGGHSFARIVHAYGDATGRELSQTLIRTVRGRENIRVAERAFVIDLLTDVDGPGGRCVGVIALVEGRVQILWAKRTILASGGAGQLFRESSNPKIATADGHAMAYRAGARVQDMEMVQFHPTTLYVAGSSRALITEAVRGEGAYLVDRNGYRFMKDYHEQGELAPRDVVSRAIVEQIRKTHFTHVFLDVRHLPTGEFRDRFPSLAKLTDEFDIDVAKDLIPIHPAAHYMIGGVDADEFGRTSLAGLYAIGEAACSGLHGANRLASNSLLEGLAFGARAGEHAAGCGGGAGGPVPAVAGGEGRPVGQDRAGRDGRQEQFAVGHVAERRHRAGRRPADRDAGDRRLLEPVRDGQDVPAGPGRRGVGRGRVGAAEPAHGRVPGHDGGVQPDREPGGALPDRLPGPGRRPLADAPAVAAAERDADAGGGGVRGLGSGSASCNVRSRGEPCRR